MAKLRKVLKRVGLCVFIPALAYILTCIVADAIWFNQINAELEAIKSKGQPVDPDDLMRMTISSRDNGAIVYQEIFRVVEKTTTPNDITILTKFASGHTQNNLKLCDRTDAILSRDKQILAMIEKAESRPQCSFLIGRQDGYSLLLPKTIELRYPMRLLSANAIQEAHRGRMNESVLSIKQAFKMIESLKSEPSVVGQLVRVALYDYASKGLHESLRFGDISEAQAKSLFDILADMDIERGFVRGCEGDRVAILDIMSQMNGKLILLILVKDNFLLYNKPPNYYSNPLLFVNAYKALPPIAKVKYRIIGDAYCRSGFLGDRITMLRSKRNTIDSMSLPYKEVKSTLLTERTSQMPFYAVCTKFMGSTETGIKIKRYVGECKVAGDQVFLALLAFKDRYGAYPASMSELKSKLGWEILVDPYSGGDFKYKRQGRGFVVYSVGPNMKDDGGVQHNKQFFDASEKGDFVWEMDH